MAESPATTEPNPQQSEPSNPPQSNQLDPATQPSSTTSLPLNPNPPPPPSIIQVSSVLPTAPFFRPATPPIPVPSAPQFSPLPMPNLPNPRIQNPTVQPPGVTAVAPPTMMQPYASFGNPVLRHYMPMPNGYSTQGTLPPPGIPRYPSPFTPMVRPTFPPRPPGVIGIIPPFSRPPIPGIRGPIIMPPVVRPAVVPSVTPTEKPQTTVYVGKIASTVESDFVLSLLQLCGPVKNWKRAHDPTNGSPKGFGFCEFESADGVLRALRLLSKLNVDGQELVINVTQATREYLQCYVEKKAENSKKLKEIEAEEADKKEETAQSAEKSEAPTPSVEDSRKDEDSGSQENSDSANFGIVTDEDREADQEALDKLRVMIEDRLKNNPLPPPPPPPLTAADGSGNSNSEQPARSKDGDSDMNAMRDDAAGDKNEDEMTSDSKPTSEHERPETSSPDRSKKYDRRVRDRERDLKREKEKELERNEKERGQERARREREREYKNRDDDRRYRARVEEWEYREREKEKLRKQEKEKEKDRENKRKREIMDQEHENDEVDSKRRKHKSVSERKRRLREKEEDLADRQREEEEAAEAKRRADEELQQRKQQEKDAMEIYPGHETIVSNKSELHDESDVGSKDKAVEETYDGDSGHGDDIGGGIIRNGNEDESVMESIAASDIHQNRDVTAKKLGFGLVGSGKRTAVPSVFDEEDEDAQKEKKMRPLVPIDYSTEELQAVHSAISDAPSSNLAVAAEFAKRISSAIPREERPDAEKERSRRSHDRSRQRDRDRDRNDDESHETNRTRNEGRKESFERARDWELVLDKVKTADNQKLLDAKQLIDMIPKTKDELFSYEINWDVYDKNELHDRMRPWISKKIKEFLGEEETSLVDYIVSTTREHVKASIMLERLQAILDDEAEMFVLKMWRMLIFEIKKIETGLALRSKT